MKLIRESLYPLFEIGEGIKPYNLRYLGKLDNFRGEKVEEYAPMIGYEFITEDNDKYIITFLAWSGSEIIDGKIFNVRVDFEVLDKKPNIIVNKGRIFRVLSTVVEAIKNYLIKNPQTFSFIIFASKNKDNKNIRLNLYSKYIEKQIPSGWEVKYVTVADEDAGEGVSNIIIQLVNLEKYEEYKKLRDKSIHYWNDDIKQNK
jgi:hypothetical protein